MRRPIASPRVKAFPTISSVSFIVLSILCLFFVVSCLFGLLFVRW